MEDEKIIDLYFQRDEAAISESDRKYGHYLKTVSYNVLRNTEDSEECVSDTWLHAWNSIPPTRPRILKAWFAKVTRNLSLNRLQESRAQKRGGGVGRGPERDRGLALQQNAVGQPLFARGAKQQLILFRSVRHS